MEKYSERVRILGIDTFETRYGKRLKRQASYAGISVDRALELGIKAKRFASDCFWEKL